MTGSIKQIIRAEGFIQALASTLSDRDIMDGKPGNVMRVAQDINAELDSVVKDFERILDENRKQYDDGVRMKIEIERLKGVILEKDDEIREKDDEIELMKAGVE